MDYVEVTIISPSGKVARDSDEESLVPFLVKSLNLKTRSDDGKTEIKYAVNLLGGVKIKEGSVLQVFEVKPPPPPGFDIVPKKKR